MQILIRLSQSTALKLYKAQSRSKKKPPLNMFNTVESAHKILFFLPPDTETSVSAQLLNDIKKHFHQHVIVIVKRAHSVLPDSLPGLMKIIEIDEENDVTFMGLPTKGLKNNLVRENASVAVDLSREFDFLNTALVVASKARLMAGFFHPKREFIYNFVLRACPSASLQQSVESLFTYLTCDKDSDNPPGSSRTANSIINY